MTTTVTTVFPLEDTISEYYSQPTYNEKTQSFFTIATRQYDFIIKEWSTITKEQKKIDFNDPSKYKIVRCAIVSHHQTLWASDGLELVHELSLTGHCMRTFGVTDERRSVDGSIHEARFNRPVSLAVDKHGSIYVAEQNAIRKISKEGLVSTFYRSNSDKLLSFAVLTFCNTNNCLYMLFDLQIWKITPHSAHIIFTSNKHIYIAASNFGSLFYACSGGIYKLDLSTLQPITVVSREKIKTKLGLDDLYHLTFDSKNNLYFVGYGHVYKLCFLSWKTERWLWIGKLKNHPRECLLAALPKELLIHIRNILRDGC